MKHYCDSQPVPLDFLSLTFILGFGFLHFDVNHKIKKEPYMVSIQLAESSVAPMANTCKSKAITRLLPCLIIVTL